MENKELREIIREVEAFIKNHKNQNLHLLDLINLKEIVKPLFINQEKNGK